MSIQDTLHRLRVEAASERSVRTASVLARGHRVLRRYVIALLSVTSIVGTAMVMAILLWGPHARTSPRLEKPIATAIVSPSPNPNGWNKTPVTVTFACRKPYLPSCPNPEEYTTNGRFHVEPPVGRDGTTRFELANDVTVNIDTVAPMMNPLGSVSRTWHNAPLVVRWTCTDGLSGVANGAIESAEILGDGIQQARPSEHCVDLAGNQAPDDIVNVPFDRKPPTAVLVSRSTRAGRWSGESVRFVWRCVEGHGESGPKAATVIAWATKEGRYSGARATCADNAGNVTATSASAKIDRTPPTTTLEHEASTLLGGEDVVTVTAVDSLSGIQRAYLKLVDQGGQVFDETSRGCESSCARLSWSVSLPACEGSLRIEAYSLDNAGNGEAPPQYIDVRPAIGIPSVNCLLKDLLGMGLSRPGSPSSAMPMATLPESRRGRREKR